MSFSNQYIEKGLFTFYKEQQEQERKLQQQYRQKKQPDKKKKTCSDNRKKYNRKNKNVQQEQQLLQRFNLKNCHQRLKGNQFSLHISSSPMLKKQQIFKNLNINLQRPHKSYYHKYAITPKQYKLQGNGIKNENICIDKHEINEERKNSIRQINVKKDIEDKENIKQSRMKSKTIEKKQRKSRGTNSTQYNIKDINLEIFQKQLKNKIKQKYANQEQRQRLLGKIKGKFFLSSLHYPINDKQYLNSKSLNISISKNQSDRYFCNAKDVFQGIQKEKREIKNLPHLQNNLNSCVYPPLYIANTKALHVKYFNTKFQKKMLDQNKFILNEKYRLIPKKIKLRNLEKLTLKRFNENNYWKTQQKNSPLLYN